MDWSATILRFRVVQRQSWNRTDELLGEGQTLPM